jgi:hypothetical protein
MEDFSFISKETFDEIIHNFLQNSKSRTNEKQLITKSLYNEIKAVLLDGNSMLRDADFRFWCRKGFTLLKVGEDYVVCKNLNDRTKEALIKENKSVDALPVLILEEMYRVIGLEHVHYLHCGQKTLYNKLRSKWYGVKKKIIEEFVNHCEICVPRRNTSKSTLAAKPIVAKRFLSRLQVI